ncbi:GSCOCG00013460001-RA-CDS [Cotesia congregata]|nr:GSCOCG00013460001-RA-CDS [Cotesia congregata]
MVRIKLTDPLNKVHEILESSAVQPTTPEVEPLALPTTEVSANGLASGLIAGFTEPQGTEMSMEMIQFDQLPMISVLKLENSSQASTETVPKVELVTEADPESKTPEPQVRKDQKKETSLEKTVTSATEKEPERWTLIPQTSPKPKEPVRTEAPPTGKRPSVMQPSIPGKPEPPRSPDPPSQHIPLDHSKTTPGLDSSVLNLEPDVLYFSNLCNDLAFNLWSAVNQGLSKSRSLAVSPFGMTSLLAMIFLGARGPTSNQMNDVLKLDDITTFNPHLIFQNVTDSVASRRNQGIANAVFVRELFADKLKVNKLMTFYKEQAQKFYDGIVAEVNFSFVSNAVKRRTNLLIRKQTGGRIREFVKDNNLVPLRSPLAAVSANVFQTDCSSGNATSEGRDGELYFAVAPTVKLRKLVPVPATLWKAGVLAGYETSLDATAIALGGLDKMVSVIFVIPGSQGGLATGDNLEKLEGRIVNGALHDGAWNKLLKVIIPRPGLELQVPKFSHKSIINSTAALKNMGLEDIFEKHANLRGINDIGKDLHLADVFQMNLFSTCGDENFLAGKHHEEVYPASSQRNARSEEITEENSTIGQEKTDTYYESEAERIARFTRQVDNEKPRLKLDRPFLYFVRHNPTGLILYMGRFNPRLIS